MREYLLDHTQELIQNPDAWYDFHSSLFDHCLLGPHFPCPSNIKLQNNSSYCHLLARRPHNCQVPQNQGRQRFGFLVICKVLTSVEHEYRVGLSRKDHDFHSTHNSNQALEKHH